MNSHCCNICITSRRKDEITKYVVSLHRTLRSRLSYAKRNSSNVVKGWKMTESRFNESNLNPRKSYHRISLSQSVIRSIPGHPV